MASGFQNWKNHRAPWSVGLLVGVVLILVLILYGYSNWYSPDSSEPLDTDDDGYTELDTDGDRYTDDVDAFDDDPSEWWDHDNDGVGDNADFFPFDPSETMDSDYDGVGNNKDAFPYDPAETEDTDNDGVGNNKDAFPYDPDETQDSDHDGLGDNLDVDDDNDGILDYQDVPPDTEGPAITLNFAGAGNADNMDYTNASHQQENWILVNATVTDTTGVGTVWLQWYNDTRWTNFTYHMVGNGGYYEYNMTENISPGYNYSFALYANDTSPANHSSVVTWTYVNGFNRVTQKYVQLGHPSDELTYSQFYLYNASYNEDPVNATVKAGCLHHEQGLNDGDWDTGYLLSDTPTDAMQERKCGTFVGFYIDESLAINASTAVENLYYHVWWNTSYDHATMLTAGYKKEPDFFGHSFTPGITVSTDEARSNASVSGWWDYPEYHLFAGSLVTTTGLPAFNDNDIYEFISVFSTECAPSIISNRSYPSFVIINPPDNATLKTMDTDADLLTDYEELFVTYTDPQLGDTDNDGKNDYVERFSGTDPNDPTR